MRVRVLRTQCCSAKRWKRWRSTATTLRSCESTCRAAPTRATSGGTRHVFARISTFFCADSFVTRTQRTRRFGGLVEKTVRELLEAKEVTLRSSQTRKGGTRLARHDTTRHGQRHDTQHDTRLRVAGAEVPKALLGPNLSEGRQHALVPRPRLVHVLHLHATTIVNYIFLSVNKLVFSYLFRY